MKLKSNHEPALGESVIASGVHVKGHLTCDSDLMIDGNLEGDIKVTGAATIGVNARIDGNISATHLILSGQVNGNINITESTTLEATGRLIGDITTNSLGIAPGAVLIGTVTMPDHESPSKE